MVRFHLPLALALLVADTASAQQFGAKVLGGVGIDAGTQGPPGLFLLDRFLQFNVQNVRDRNGAVVPIDGLDASARANALGAAYTFVIPGAPYFTVAATIPWAHISINANQPLLSVDRFGLADIFVQPVRAGWRESRFDVVTSYGFFAPTGKFQPKIGPTTGRGFWSNQVTLGGAVYRDTTRAQRASALLSFERNERMRGIDLTRGNTLQLQGGAGTTVRRILVVGVAGYALWQVSDDRGADVPPAIAGARTRVYGLGPEVQVLIPALRLRGEFRFEWDFGVRARPQGDEFAGGLTYRAWAPAVAK